MTPPFVAKKISWLRWFFFPYFFASPFLCCTIFSASSRAEPCHDVGGWQLLYLVSVPQRKLTIICNYRIIAILYRDFQKWHAVPPLLQALRVYLRSMLSICVMSADLVASLQIFWCYANVVLMGVVQEALSATTKHQQLLNWLFPNQHSARRRIWNMNITSYVFFHCVHHSVVTSALRNHSVSIGLSDLQNIWPCT